MIAIVVGISTPAFCAPSFIPSGRSIWVDKSRQRLVAFDGSRIIMATRCSTASKHPHYAPGDDRYEKPITPVGDYHIFRKEADHFSRSYEVHMRYALFYDGGRAVHATFPNLYAYLGQPASGGCVRLTKSEAQRLFGWAHVGDPVYVVTELPNQVLAMVPSLGKGTGPTLLAAVPTTTTRVEIPVVPLKPPTTMPTVKVPTPYTPPPTPTVDSTLPPP